MVEVSRVEAFRDNYIWLLHAPADRSRVVVVDPGDAVPVRARLARDGLTLAAILVTHHHPDHVGGIEGLSAPTVFGPANESIPCRTHALRDGDSIEVEGLAFGVMEIPGHTAGHIAYHGHGLALVGDTLFTAGCGRLFEGTPEQMQASLARIRALPGDTAVYCGHEYTLANLAFARAVEPDNEALTARERAVRALREAGEATVPGTLSEELATNPFLRWDAPAVIAAASRRAGRSLTTPVEVFATVRRWKDEF